jgi:hypothetical protein
MFGITLQIRFEFQLVAIIVFVESLAVGFSLTSAIGSKKNPDENQYENQIQKNNDKPLQPCLSRHRKRLEN